MNEGEYPGLELDEDREVLRRSWIAESVEWWLLIAVVFAAVVGLWGGSGLLLRTSAQDGALSVEYSRFLRNGGPETLAVSTRPSADSATVRMPPTFARDFQIQRVVPEPASVRRTDEALEYVFDAPAPGFQALYDIVPRRVGPHRLAVSDGQGNSVSASVFVYP